MERFLALLRLMGRRRRGRRYRADDDYQEGYEDVYYYTSKYNTHLLSESMLCCLAEGAYQQIIKEVCVCAATEQRPSSIIQERTHTQVSRRQGPGALWVITREEVLVVERNVDNVEKH